MSFPVAPAVDATVPGEAIVAYQRYAAEYSIMSPDGGNRSVVLCGGDLTHAGSPRRFISAEVDTTELPPEYFGFGGTCCNTELATSDEDCQQTEVLTQHEGNKLFGVPALVAGREHGRRQHSRIRSGERRTAVAWDLHRRRDL